MKFLAFIMLAAGAMLGSGVTHLVRGGTFDWESFWFFLGSHVLAGLIAVWAFVIARHDVGQSMSRLMVVLGYLAGIGCGIAVIVL